MSQLAKVALPFAASLILFSTLVATGAEKGPQPSLIAKQCLGCHADYSQEQSILAGSILKRSKKAGTMQVKVGAETHLVKYDQATKLNLAAELTTEVSVKISLRPDSEDLWAQEIWTWKHF
jgi:hypothetical protein